MGDIVANTKINLTGQGSFNVGDESFTWKNSFLDIVDVYSETPSLSVDVSLSGSWDLKLLTFNSAQPLDVTITDSSSSERYIEFLQLGLNRQATNSVVNLSKTSVDAIFGGGGTDVIRLGRADYGIVDGRDGNDRIETRNATVDFIRGGDGSDSVFLGSEYTGQINLLSGNDTLSFSTKSDGEYLTMANGGAGTDTLSFSAFAGGVNFSLTVTGVQDTGAGYLIAVGFDNLIGSSRADKLEGNSGANSVSGGAGNDLINGGAGRDVLTGGAGNDRFLFDTKLGSTNVDRITEYSVAADTIVLDNVILDVLREGKLAAAAFVINTSGRAADASDRIIYERDSGKIWYDENGNAAGGAVHFATIAANLNLTASDFIII